MLSTDPGMDSSSWRRRGCCGIAGHETPGGKMIETVTEIVMMDAEDKVNGVEGGDVTGREFSAWKPHYERLKKLLGYCYRKTNYNWHLNSEKYCNVLICIVL